MIQELKPYASYRHADIPWAPSLPTHWATRRAKTLFTKVNRRVQPSHEVVTCFRDGVVTLRKNRRSTGFTESIFEFGYQGIRRGDLVIHAMDAFAGAVGVSDSDGKGSPVYAVCEARAGALSAYYAHVVREMARSQWIVALSRGIRQRSTDFRFDVFAVQNVPVPPPEEQAAIVRFLDHANRRIDRFIRAKKKLIALLNEQKQAIIHHAVTQGLDPNAKMKRSAVSGLGDIPTHWKELRARFVLRAVTRRDVRRGDPKLSVTQRRGIVRTVDMVENSTQARSFDNFQVCHPGDVVLNKYKAHLGVFWAATERGLITPNYTVFRTIGDVDSRYLENLFHTVTYRDLFKTIVYGVTDGMSPLYTQDFYRTLVVCPPPTEQRRIVEWIPKATRGEDSSIEQAEKEISLLHKYRSRLIADIVTGQLDVRAAAVGLANNDSMSNGQPSPGAELDDPDDTDGEAA